MSDLRPSLPIPVLYCLRQNVASASSRRRGAVVTAQVPALLVRVRELGGRQVEGVTRGKRLPRSERGGEARHAHERARARRAAAGVKIGGGSRPRAEPVDAPTPPATHRFAYDLVLLDGTVVCDAPTGSSSKPAPGGWAPCPPGRFLEQAATIKAPPDLDAAIVAQSDARRQAAHARRATFHGAKAPPVDAARLALEAGTRLREIEDRKLSGLRRWAVQVLRSRGARSIDEESIAAVASALDAGEDGHAQAEAAAERLGRAAGPLTEELLARAAAKALGMAGVEDAAPAELEAVAAAMSRGDADAALRLVAGAAAARGNLETADAIMPPLPPE